MNIHCIHFNHHAQNQSKVYMTQNVHRLLVDISFTYETLYTLQKCKENFKNFLLNTCYMFLYVNSFVKFIAIMFKANFLLKT